MPRPTTWAVWLLSLLGLHYLVWRLTATLNLAGTAAAILSLTALAAELVARGTIERIVASPMARTRETAAIVSQALGLPVEIDDGLAVEPVRAERLEAAIADVQLEVVRAGRQPVGGQRFDGAADLAVGALVQDECTESHAKSPSMMRGGSSKPRAGGRLAAVGLKPTCGPDRPPAPAEEPPGVTAAGHVPPHPRRLT